MSTVDKLKRILRDTLQLGARAEGFTAETPLLGAIPEFDSMAVVNVLAMIESEFGITVDDADVSAEVFETIGSLAAFVEGNAAR
jgi:acyl carrier protein